MLRAASCGKTFFHRVGFKPKCWRSKSTFRVKIKFRTFETAQNWLAWSISSGRFYSWKVDFFHHFFCTTLHEKIFSVSHFWKIGNTSNNFRVFFFRVWEQFFSLQILLQCFCPQRRNFKLHPFACNYGARELTDLFLQLQKLSEKLREKFKTSCTYRAGYKWLLIWMKPARTMKA